MVDQTNSTRGKHRRSVGVFPNRQTAEQALYELRDSGFSMDRVSVVTQDKDQPNNMAGASVDDRIGNKADEGATVGAISGGTLGGLTGLLVGLGTLAIPGVGPIMLAGTTATALATTLAGGAIGAVTGGLLGALIGLGIPEERARVYQDRISRGGYLVIVDGTDAEIARAEAILHRRGIEDYGVYDAPERTADAAYTAAPMATAPVVHPTTDTTPETKFGRRYAVGFFPSLQDAEYAVTDLRSINFPLNQITLVAQKFQRQEHLVGIDLRDRFEAMRLGIPTNQARSYNDRITRGEYMVIVHGTEDELNRAAPVLNRRGIQEWRIYDPTEVRTTTPTVEPATQGTQAVVGTPAARTTDLTLSQHRRAIGTFAHRRDAEAALTELRQAGFPMDRLSVVAKDTDHNDRIAGVNLQDRADNKADEGAKAGATTGGVLGGLGGLLVGLGTLAIPGIGPIVLGGAAATALATALSGGAIGAAAGGLAGALVGLGIPEDRAKVYNDRLVRGDYLVMVDGTEDEIRRAETILHRRGIQDWGIYDATNSGAVDRTVESTGRYAAPDVEPTRGDRSARVEHPTPEITIIDRRDETRR